MIHNVKVEFESCCFLKCFVDGNNLYVLKLVGIQLLDSYVSFILSFTTHQFKQSP